MTRGKRVEVVGGAFGGECNAMPIILHPTLFLRERRGGFSSQVKKHGTIR
jgi:hypothetical protein